MTLERQIGEILIWWFLAFVSIRALLSGIIVYQLNPSASKKRKKVNLSKSGSSIPGTEKKSQKF